MSTKVKVAVLPKCDICQNETAKYDAMTTQGPWAYQCAGCFADYGVGLGLGKGQELVVA